MKPGPKPVDLTGQRYGRLSVLSDGGLRRPGKRSWLCRCDCGQEKLVGAGELKAGKATSCGCYRRELMADKQRTHGGKKHADARVRSMYSRWGDMKKRCRNPRHPQYADYGGRGIEVCPRWLDSFESFLADMGLPVPGMTLDREDNDGPYSPDNCRWADRVTQNNNRRDRLRLDGMTPAEYGRATGLSRWTVTQVFARAASRTPA